MPAEPAAHAKLTESSTEPLAATVRGRARPATGRDPRRTVRAALADGAASLLPRPPQSWRRCGRSLLSACSASRSASASGGSSPGASPRSGSVALGAAQPGETFASFPSLWFDRALTRNTADHAAAAWPGLRAGRPRRRAARRALRLLHAVQRLLPAADIFGRNIPVAALIPLTFSLFGIGELQKVMFIFIACVAFIISDTARRSRDVGEPVHRHGLHAGGQPLADDHQGAGAAGDARHLQLAAAAVRPGLRLHHAGRDRSSSAASRAAWATSSTRRSAAARASTSTSCS